MRPVAGACRFEPDRGRGRRYVAHQRPPPRRAQNTGRGGRRTRRAVAQRMAGPRRDFRSRIRGSATPATRQPALHRVGALAMRESKTFETPEPIAVTLAMNVADVRISAGELRGPAVVKNLNGPIWIGLAADDLRCSSSNGEISFDRALGAVEAKTANGDVRVGEVVRGTVAVKTAYGRLEIGIREGTAALLDVSSSFGRVENSLQASEGPQPSDETVQLRARTSYGDILIHRSKEAAQ